jgi:hypothetical protein
MNPKGLKEVDMNKCIQYKREKVGKYRVLWLTLVGFLSLGAGALRAEIPKTMTVGGRVTNAEGKKIAGIRVWAEFELGSQDGVRGYAVTYSDEKGQIFLNLPIGKTVQLSTSGQGYGRFRGQQSVIVGSTTLNFPILVEEGLADIEPGSMDQAQLYVNLDQQRVLDELIEKGRYDEIATNLDRMVTRERERNWGYCLAGHFLLQRGLSTEAERFFLSGGSGWYANRAAAAAYKKGNDAAALEGYAKGEITWDRASDLFKLARRFALSGDTVRRDSALNMAIDGYKRAVSSFFMRSLLETEGAMARIMEMGALDEGFFNPQDPLLESLLGQVGAYCRTMEKRSILYMYKESKLDRIMINTDLAQAEEKPMRHFSQPGLPDYPLMPVEVREEYDVQLYETDEGKIEESRKLLHKKIENKFDVPQLDSIDFQKAHFGPNSMVGTEIQPYFNYRIIGEKEIFDVPAVIIEAIPKWAASANVNPGIIWVSRKNGAVLKIERFYKLDKDQNKVRLRGLILAMEPRLIFTSEFSFEKNGIRYPSRLSVRESYFDGGLEKITRLEIESRFSDYQFFGVSSDVTVEKIKE